MDHLRVDIISLSTTPALIVMPFMTSMLDPLIIVDLPTAKEPKLEHEKRMVFYDKLTIGDLRLRLIHRMSGYDRN